MKKIFIFILFILNTCQLFSQKNKTQNLQKKKFFINVGYGLGGSFAARDYNEFAPLPQYRIFQKKNFIGTSAEGSIGIILKRNWEVRVGLNYQNYARKVKSTDTLNGGVIFNLDQIIHLKSYLWYSVATKHINSKKHSFIPGLGIYYLETKNESISIFPGYISDREFVQRGSYNGQAGAFGEISYEYQFQPKVNIGLRSQFYYTLSIGYQESVTFYPYIKIIL